MDRIKLSIEGIPALVWGEASERVILAVHGSSSHKADTPIALLAQCASEKGCQVLSFDLPGHGERAAQPAHCGVQEGVRELRIILRYAQENWKRISLFANSLGAYFSLLAYAEAPLERAWFLSPLVDMQRMIANMMNWFGVSEERLKREREIPTPAGQPLEWDYYCYVREHPVQVWNVPTEILYGGADETVERDTVETFVRRFSCRMEVVPEAVHYFHTPEQMDALRRWLEKTM